ncbi:MAG: hypothetical protein HRF49_03770 [bacterium]|jgi:hypothetical protein
MAMDDCIDDDVEDLLECLIDQLIDRLCNGGGSDLEICLCNAIGVTLKEALEDLIEDYAPCFVGCIAKGGARAFCMRFCMGQVMDDLVYNFGVALTECAKAELSTELCEDIIESIIWEYLLKQ